MDISNIDKNLKINSNINKSDIIWLRSTSPQFVTYGAYSCEPFCRIPQSVAENTNEGVKCLNYNTAGVRLRFRTDSPYIALHAEWDSLCKMPHMTTVGISGFDLYSYSSAGHCQKFITSFFPGVDSPNGYDGICTTGGKMTDYILNFPLYNGVKALYIGVSDSAAFEEPAKYTNSLPVVFYGSSITQGGCASRPGNCYQNILSRRLDMDYINLGFSGSGKAETEIVKYMSDLKMSVFVSDYDHNAENADYLEKTHYRMYNTIREKYPDLPYIMLSKADHYFNADSDKRRAVIMKTFIKAIDNGDKNVYYIDGAGIYAGEEYDSCTMECCHPNDLGFYRFARAIYPILRQVLYFND